MASSIIFGIFLLLIGLVAGGLGTALIMGRDSRQSGKDDSEDFSQKYQELVNLWRDRENGNMLLEINGEIYKTSEDMDEKYLNRMLIIAEKLDVFLNREKSEPMTPKQIQRNDKPVEGPGFIKENPAGVDEDIKAKNLEMLKNPQKNEEPQKPVFNGLQKLPPEIIVPEPKAMTMIEQIDEILQRLLPFSPIAGKNVRITEDPFKGVIVWVGLDKYEGIDDVPDKDIRIVIRAAVAEWEKQADSRRK